MKKLAKKTAAIMLTSLLAIALTAGLSAAENKLVVEDGLANTVFAVDNSGNTGFNLSTPNYAADVVSPGSAAKSQLHFSLDGTDNGGYITSVLPNNFWISSGAVFDATTGGWIQKSADGQSVFFGSGAAGFRAFLQEGNTQGQVLSNVKVAITMDYGGNMKVGGGIQMNNGSGVTQPACNSSSQGMIWMTKGSTDLLQVCASKGGSLAWYNLSF
jgi:hypothetical protein